IDLAPLRITAGCPPTGCSENAVLFAPTYEASARPAWGRVYGQVGLLLAGVYSQGPDRGIAQGAHGGVGVDLYGGRVMWNLTSRLLWLQRNSGENVFGVQVGVSVSPRLGGKGRQEAANGGTERICRPLPPFAALCRPGAGLGWAGLRPYITPMRVTTWAECGLIVSL